MKKRFWKTALLLVIALLILGGVWYARPVGVETLFPGLEPDQISVTVLDFDGSKQVDRSLTLLKGTPEFDELWGEFKCKKREHTIYNLTSYFSCEYYEKKDEEFINGQ